MEVLVALVQLASWVFATQDTKQERTPGPLQECLRATPLLYTTRQTCRFELTDSSLNLKFHRKKLVLPLALLVRRKHFQLRHKKECARQLAAVHPKSSKVVF